VGLHAPPDDARPSPYASDDRSSDDAEGGKRPPLSAPASEKEGAAAERTRAEEPKRSAAAASKLVRCVGAGDSDGGAAGPTTPSHDTAPSRVGGGSLGLCVPEVGAGEAPAASLQGLIAILEGPSGDASGPKNKITEENERKE